MCVDDDVFFSLVLVFVCSFPLLSVAVVVVVVLSSEVPTSSNIDRRKESPKRQI